MINDDEITKSIKLHDLTISGTRLTPKEVRILEGKVQSNQNDIDSRIILLGYYSFSRLLTNRYQKVRIANIAWFVDNEPALSIVGPLTHVFADSDGTRAYKLIKEKWLHQIQTRPNDTAILRNAADFFSVNREESLAERLLKLAQELEPSSPEWPQRLACLYHLWGDGREKLAFAACAKSVELNKENWHLSLAGRLLPGLAFDVGMLSAATEAANRLLSVKQSLKELKMEGYAIQAAHTVLGLIALQAGEIEKACAHLLCSVDEIESKQELDNPEERLAKALLEVGQAEVVLTYFEHCAITFESGKDILSLWREKLAM